MKTKDFLAQYLVLRKPRLAPSTYASYQDIVYRILIPQFGEMELDEITPLHVELFLSALLSAGASAGTVRRVYSVFRSAMTKAARMGLIKANPTGCDKIDPLPRCRKETEIFSPAEIQIILSALQKEPLRWRAFIRTAIDSGARRGELVALQWQDLESDCCHIRRAAYKLKGQPAATKPPKSGRARTLHLTAETIRLLEILRRQQKKDCLRNGIVWNMQSYVFGTRGIMMHPTSPTKWWREFLLRNQLQHRPLHALRHTSATLLLANGVDIKTVSARLGHSSLEITEIYLHLIGDADQRAAEVMEHIL